MTLYKKWLPVLLLGSCLIGGKSALSIKKLNEIIPENNISDDWRVRALVVSGTEICCSDYSILDDFPKALDGFPETIEEYRKAYKTPINLKYMILKPWKTGKLGEVLENCRWDLNSAHLIIPQKEDIVVEWINFQHFSAKMISHDHWGWNTESTAILVEVDDKNEINELQIDLLRYVCLYTYYLSCPIGNQYAPSSLGSYAETIGYPEGDISNIEEIRSSLNLKPLPNKVLLRHKTPSNRAKSFFCSAFKFFCCWSPGSYADDDYSY